MTLEEKKAKLQKQLKEIKKKEDAERKAFARDVEKARKLIKEHPEFFKDLMQSNYSDSVEF